MVNADAQMIGNLAMNNQVMLSPSAAATQRLVDRLSGMIKRWGGNGWDDNPGLLVVQLIGEKLIERAGTKLDAVIKKHPKITRRTVGILGAIGIIYYNVTFILRRKRDIIEFLMARVMTQVKIPATEYVLMHNLPGWIQTHTKAIGNEEKPRVRVIGKKQVVTVQRNAPHLSSSSSNSSTVASNDLCYKHNSAWTLFFCGWRFFVLQEIKIETGFEGFEGFGGKSNVTCQHCSAIIPSGRELQ